MSTATHIPKINPGGTGPAPAAHPVVKADPAPDWTAFNPQLTTGQKRVLAAELDRLFRLLDAAPRGELMVLSRQTAAVLVLLDDLAGQAPAVDAVIAEEATRRRETAAARPTLALALGNARRAT